MKDITAAAKVLMDLTQAGDNENGSPVFTASPGGAPADAAVAVARLGAHTALIGRTGNDELGAFLRRALEYDQQSGWFFLPLKYGPGLKKSGPFVCS